MIVAIDGPAGSGKSTVSRRLAERLGWRHLDTGAFYRAATLVVLRAGADPADPKAVEEAVRGRRFRQANGSMFLDGEDVSAAIRTSLVDENVSAVSAHAGLRSRMVIAQRNWVKDEHEDAVVEGRDIGTVVFPQAALKIWLAATPGERARRRATQTGEDPVRVEEELARRDEADATRLVSPQLPAADAIHLDTTFLTVDEVVDRIIDLVPSEGSDGEGGMRSSSSAQG
ncbi:MAG TPA: (d)CMP kinase [Acidimicrobiia bacterium]|nr:(d)CMP kinase [Acidimicrobiia bacterium]